MTIFQTAVEEIRKLRKQHEAEAEEAYRAALLDPEFADIERRIRAITPRYAKAKAFREPALTTLRSEYDHMAAERLTALKRMGLTERSFQPKYTCAKCKDTGYDGEIACTCLKQRILRLLEQDSGLIGRKLNTFADSKLDKLPEADQKALAPLYEKMRQYAEKFPFTSKRNLLFLGPSGSGKTYLINCIAAEIISRGYTVLYTTAFSLNNLFLKYHTTFDAEKTVYMDNLLNCDLLVVDDLGTEPILKNVTQEYLFSVVNERMVAGRATIASTNLSLSELQDRYGERTASRLYNKATTLTLSFKTSNLRKK